jgi:peptide/nickel transport system permease protein
MFFFIKIVIPWDFTTQFAMILNEEARDELQAALGIDLPLVQQYVNWLKIIFEGSLGRSYYGQEVLEIVKQTLPFSLLIFVPGTVIAFLIGLQLGKFTAWKGPGILTGAATLGGLTLFTAFPPWLAWLITYGLGRSLGHFRPVIGLGNLELGRDWNMDFSPSFVASRMTLSLILGILIFIAVSLLLRRFLRRRVPIVLGVLAIGGGSALAWDSFGFGPEALWIAEIAFVPALIYTLVSFGETMLIMRASMTDTLEEDYIQMARAKGLPERKIRDGHAARNALLPVLSRLVITFPYLLTGVVIIESVLSWPGVGSTLWISLYQEDMPVVMAMMIFVGMLALAGRIVLDIGYAYIDPRIRYAEQTARSK